MRAFWPSGKRFGALRDLALKNSYVRERWAGFRGAELIGEYRTNRDRYAREADARGLVYTPEWSRREVRARLAARGYQPTVRQRGEVHTFAFVPDLQWHHNLIPDLEELGPVTRFDYRALGYRVEEFDGSEAGNRRRLEMNGLVLPALREAHARRPVDWVYVYASGLEVSGNVIRQIEDELGIPTVSMCLDDKHVWEGPSMGEHRAGQVDIAGAFDLAWTSARVVCEWYMVEGGRPYYLPEGYNEHAMDGSPVEKSIPVSFVGANYGFRPLAIDFLRRHDIGVQVYGHGWPDSAWVPEIEDVFRRSLINLGMGGIGYNEQITNVKGRDFDIPGSGGGVYITTFNSDLAQHYRVGEEIVCYHNRDEMLELVRYYLKRPDEAIALGQRARARCLAEHRWLYRYEELCRVLGVMDDAA